MLSQFDHEELQRALGWKRSVWTDPTEREHLLSYIALQLASAGLLPADIGESDRGLAAFSRGMLENLREKSRLLAEHRAPVDRRIESFLAKYFEQETAAEPLRLPARTLVLDRHGMAREMSLPSQEDRFENELVESTRVANGIVNNPVHDRRTTAGTFHVVEGGLPIPGDKRAVPKETFVALFRAAMQPPKDSQLLPYTANSEQPAYTWVSLLLRPLVRPEVPGYCRKQTMETRFFAPASLVSNLDFVESIFGNAGDPLIPDNDAGLDARHWSGHTGCVILATHLTRLTKKELGLPHISKATPRQQQDRMCWEDPEERYNDGSAFKLTCRDESGVMITLIADNYYGYCKKEVKTQISYAANMMGGVEEEHAGGALAFASYSLGDEFRVNSRRYNDGTFAEVAREYSSFIDVRPEGYGIDRNFPTLIYIPEDAIVSQLERCVKWEKDGQEQRIRLSPENVYMAPSGYQIRLEKHHAAPSWRLVGTVGEGIMCHKPCTVSGGGKSEISKSLRDYMLYGPIFVADQEKDFEQLDELFKKDYRNRWHPEYEDKPDYSKTVSRTLLDPSRSLGSVIQLLTPTSEYSDEYNAWLDSIPEHIYSLALIIKRFTKPGMEANWREHFGVDIVNGTKGHQLKLGRRDLVGTYLRVGLHEGSWRTFKLRQDFIPAAKVQCEDDITASTIVPARNVGPVGAGVAEAGSYKFLENCEYRLFQRPDDAIHRGLDKQTELDLSQPGSFISNFQPLTAAQANELVEDVIDFDQYTEPMQQLLQQAAERDSGYVASSAHPRVMPDGRVTKNPRYLQDRPDLVHARATYIAERGMRLFRKTPVDQAVTRVVGAVLAGRRNNPPDKQAGIRSLAVYNPLHYQELPELCMDWICSLTGKSPSTTGAGSEGALTKGPFNALVPTADLNAALVGMILTGLGGFSTAAGHVGPHFEVGHDISLLIPELWCRMGPHERDPQAMIRDGMLEPLEDFEHEGETIPASRLGYRITGRFVRRYAARVFDNPSKVFSDSILRPELQDAESFTDGILHIAEAQRKVAQRYLDDGSLQSACPPLQAILHIMVHGHWNGHDIRSEEVRGMFTREYLLESDWYRERLRTKQQRDVQRWSRVVEELKAYAENTHHGDAIEQMNIGGRLEYAQQQLQRVRADSFVEELVGTIGADPMKPIEVAVPAASTAQAQK
ncbi:hypothetical protein [Roseimaritima ulvae]|uniref:PPi-type phosphoenolpyruvate carboxykinase lobe 2 domain-containing protein n=2 Tax=Roseimaritima ulvae TaxID=980254 RepID=A0A5B9QZS6_9BACT|nr:hypothetical protein UC8_55490 [Roseimaritima ulvae]